MRSHLIHTPGMPADSWLHQANPQAGSNGP
jgi:hypothetical protein